MALFSSTQPSLRAQVLPRIPAHLLAGTGITVTKSGRNYTIAAPSVTNAVTAGAVITDNRLVRGDGGSRGVQESSISVDDSGNLTSVGNVAFAGQLSFPATQNPSSGANVLDDYEEGQFTPQLLFGGASVSMTGSFAGVYTKIGNRVFFALNVTLTAKGSSTGDATISGLPFTPVDVGGGVPWLSVVTPGAGLVPLWDVNGGVVRLRTLNLSTGANASMVETAFANTSAIRMSGTYGVS